jgi:hypothetical protein
MVLPCAMASLASPMVRIGDTGRQDVSRLPIRLAVVARASLELFSHRPRLENRCISPSSPSPSSTCLYLCGSCLTVLVGRVAGRITYVTQLSEQARCHRSGLVQRILERGLRAFYDRRRGQAASRLASQPCVFHLDKNRPPLSEGNSTRRFIASSPWLTPPYPTAHKDNAFYALWARTAAPCLFTEFSLCSQAQ